MSKIYTAAEVKAMEDEIDNDQPEAGPNQVMVKVGGMDVVVVLPEAMAALVTALPIVTRLFSDEVSAVSNSRNLHKVLGTTYKHGAWIKRVIDDCQLTEGEHFWREEVQTTVENMKEVAANGNEKIFFSLKAARKITLRSNSPDAHLLFEYYDAVVNAATPYLLKRLAKSEQDRLGEKRWADKMEAKADSLTKERGFHSVTLAVSHKHDLEARDQLIEKLQNEAGKAESVKSLERLIEASAKHMKRVASNPDKVKVLAEDVMTGLAAIRGGNVGYCPAF